MMAIKSLLLQLWREILGKEVSQGVCNSLQNWMHTSAVRYFDIALGRLALFTVKSPAVTKC